MQVKREHFLVPIVVIAAGVALICAGLWRRWGIVWAAAGGIFVVLGVGAELLALAGACRVRRARSCSSRSLGY